MFRSGRMFVLPHELARAWIVRRHGFRCGDSIVEVPLGNRTGVAALSLTARNVSPTTFTVKDKAAFLPVTYSSFVRELKAGEPKLEPPWDTMKNSFVEYG